MYKALILLLIIFLVSSQNPPSEEPSTTISKESFYSDVTHSAFYNLNQIKPNHPLVFILTQNKTSSTSPSIEKNHAIFHIATSTSNTTCTFDSYNRLCVVKEIPQDNLVSLNVTCKDLPCDLQWKMYQPSLVRNIEKLMMNPSVFYPDQHLYEIPENLNHIMMGISCFDRKDEVKVFSDIPSSVILFESSKSVNDKTVSVLINNEKESFIFILTKTVKSRCMSLLPIFVDQDIIVNDRRQIVDYVRNDSWSVFKLNENPEKGLRMLGYFSEYDVSTDRLESAVEVVLSGEMDGKRQTIEHFVVNPLEKEKFHRFSIIFKQISHSHKNLEIGLKSTKNVLNMIQTITPGSEQETIGIMQQIYFLLRKGEKIGFKLKKYFAMNNETVKINVWNEQALSASKKECGRNQGCEFEVQALQDANVVIYYDQKYQIQLRTSPDGASGIEIETNKEESDSSQNIVSSPSLTSEENQSESPIHLQNPSDQTLQKGNQAQQNEDSNAHSSNLQQNEFTDQSITDLQSFQPNLPQASNNQSTNNKTSKSSKENFYQELQQKGISKEAIDTLKFEEIRTLEELKHLTDDDFKELGFKLGEVLRLKIIAGKAN